mmetsp:Transcript_15660/g.45201  ORF Transcript_15660/g.45201 Transcript_15660/m.45201 type:complete len:298 (-) Transcript_15660:369-1262(-)
MARTIVDTLRLPACRALPPLLADALVFLAHAMVAAIDWADDIGADVGAITARSQSIACGAHAIAVVLAQALPRALQDIGVVRVPIRAAQSLAMLAVKLALANAAADSIRPLAVRGVAVRRRRHEGGLRGRLGDQPLHRGVHRQLCHARRLPPRGHQGHGLLRLDRSGARRWAAHADASLPVARALRRADRALRRRVRAREACVPPFALARAELALAVTAARGVGARHLQLALLAHPARLAQASVGQVAGAMAAAASADRAILPLVAGHAHADAIGALAVPAAPVRAVALASDPRVAR